MAAELDKISTRGYEGPSFDSLPDDLRARVRGAAGITEISGIVRIKVAEVVDPSPVTGDWTDAFVSADRDPVGSVHRIGDQIFTVTYGGVVNAHTRGMTQARLGFERSEAQSVDPLIKGEVLKLLSLSPKSREISCYTVRRVPGAQPAVRLVARRSA